MGYHIQTGNKDDFLALDFGLKEFGVLDAEERLNRYRRYLYEAGALSRTGKSGAGVIDNSILEKKKKMILSLSVSKGSDIVADILRIPGLTVPKNLFTATITDSKIFLCQKGIRYPSGWQVWMGFIH